MKNIHDLIVIGAGLSSLMFLSQYIKKSTNQSILLLEQKNSIKQDQTFCVWEGPGLHNITDQFHLKPKKIWSKVALNEAGTEIKRHINPYKYVCFDGGETLKKLTEACAPKVTTISNEKVDRIIHRNGTHEITTTNGTYYTKCIIDSRSNFKPHEIKSSFIKQAFIGHEIETDQAQFNPNEVTLMSFRHNKDEVEFNYLLPFSEKRALVETTVFSSLPNLKKIESSHAKLLKKYGSYKTIRQEKAIIPMAVIDPDEEQGILRIGTGAGMIRASSGYSMRRIANWVLTLQLQNINERNISQFKYKPNFLLNWLDKIFLNVIYSHPEKGPYLFMTLFERASMPSLVRFLSDGASRFDLTGILLSMPKMLMLKGLLKAKDDDQN